MNPTSPREALLAPSISDAAIRPFWVASGFVLLDRDADGRLLVTDAYLRAYLARPELMPPEEACAAERRLHAELLADPRQPVAPAEIDALADPEARENWRFALALRDRLIAAGTVEDAYRGIVRDGGAGLPPVFLDQLVHLILRNALEACEDAYVARAAELFYRPQRATFRDGRVLLADAELVEHHAADHHASPLLAMLGEAAADTLDVLTAENADAYWGRSDAHDFVLDLGGTPGGRAALGEAIRLFVHHMHGLAVKVTAMERIEDSDWRWFVGLDAEGTRIGNAVWRGETEGPAGSAAAAARLLALFRLDLPAEAPVLPQAAGHPVYLLLGVDGDDMVRLKPQNLVAGLPLVETSPGGDPQHRGA